MFSLGKKLIRQFPDILQMIQWLICKAIDPNFFSVPAALKYMFVLLQISDVLLKAQ